MYRLDLFPINGLDRSLHAPVLLGLLVLTFFAETLGWTYAGLVVPGYLAAVLLTAPATAGLVVVEAVLTYGLAALLGRWLPRTGVWSTTFGRERFFLFIVGAVVVRLAVEGNLVPYLVDRYELAHSRELYSLGLVLVPLLSNMFWNAGMRVSAPRLFIVTGITFVLVKYVLLAYTNFTISRFEVANESVSLTFLESPHAHIILLVGALLAARNNVLYGWDYNGILVPALLGVAWYQPTKLLTTVVEALFVYWAAVAITSRGPLSRMLIVGSRRMLVAFGVGFVVKLLLGFAALAWDRSIQMVDYFGFGYLLPSLLAVKIWNKSKIGVVIMPTLQVSLLAFVAGNLVGMGLGWFDQTERLALAAPSAAWSPHDTSRALLLGDTQPAPRAPEPGSPEAAAPGIALRLAREGTANDRMLNEATAAGLALGKRQGGWLTVTPRSQDPDDDRIAPRLAIRTADAAAKPWLVLVATEKVGSPAVPLGVSVAEWLGARAIMLYSHLPQVRKSDELFSEQLVTLLALPRTLFVSVGGPRPRLSVVGVVPEGLDAVGLGQALGVELEITFRARSSSGFRLVDSPRLELPRALAERLSAHELDAPSSDHWPRGVALEISERVLDLTTVGRGYVPPSIEELRLFGGSVVPELIAAAETGPSAWTRALAAEFGYRFVSAGGTPESPDAWGLVEPPGPERRGNASCFVRVPRSGGRTVERLGVEIPAPRWEVGTVAAATGLFGGLDADMLLLAGALPTDPPAALSDVRRPTAVRSFYQRIHERWLDATGNVIAVTGSAPDRPAAADAVLSFGVELPDSSQKPEWTRPVSLLLERSGLGLRVLDGSVETASLERSSDPSLAYALRFATGQMLTLYLSPELRARLVRAQEDRATALRIERAEREAPPGNVVERALTLARCSRPDATRPGDDPVCARARLSSCDLVQVTSTFERYAATKNPFDLELALKGDGCVVELLTDAATGRVWVLSSAKGRVQLVPLLGGPAVRAPKPIRDPEELRYAAALGLASLTVESL